MKSIIVSIIIPVGKEFSGLRSCLWSFVGKAPKENYEILVGLDEGDYKNIGVVLEMENKLPLRTFIWEKDPGYYTMHLKTNWLAKKAKGEIIWWLSDECRMVTNNWVNMFIKPCKYNYRPILIHPKTKPVNGAKYPAINRCWYKKTKQFTGHPSLDSWLNTVRERANAKLEIVDVTIKEVERPNKETERGKVMGIIEGWNSNKLEKELNEEAEKLKWKNKERLIYK